MSPQLWGKEVTLSDSLNQHSLCVAVHQVPGWTLGYETQTYKYGPVEGKLGGALRGKGPRVLGAQRAE